MESSAYLSCKSIRSLRYRILSADLSDLSIPEQKQAHSITSYLLEEYTLCNSSRAIKFSEDEIQLINKLLETSDISSVSDLQQLVEET